MTAACLREIFPSLIGRSDDLAPRPMMNWSLSIRYFWLSKTRYSGGSGTLCAPSEGLTYDGDDGVIDVPPWWKSPGGGIGRENRDMVGLGAPGGGGGGPSGA